MIRFSFALTFFLVGWMGAAWASSFAEIDLQREIDARFAQGGGTVRVAPGTWWTKPFVLKSNITLELSEGATLFASTNLADYAHLPRGKRYFVFAEGATNVSIVGKGILNGRGGVFRESVLLEGSSQPQDLPVMMRFSRCRNVRLEDFTYRDGGAWGCHLRNCDGVTMRRVKCHNHVNNTNDGIDIESSNVLIEECDIDANDDALCFKTESDKSFLVTNVVVRNSRFASCCNGVKFGTGSYSAVRDVVIENCDFYRPTARHGSSRAYIFPGVTNCLGGIAGMALEVVDGGSLENVTLRNITIDGYMTPVFIRLGRRHEALAGRTSRLENVLIENLRASVADSWIASSITGVPGLRPRNIVLRNVELSFPGGGTAEDAQRPVPEMEKSYPEATMFHLGWPDHVDFFKAVLPAWGFYVRHADDVTFERVRLHCLGADARKPIVTDDCTNFCIRQGIRGAAPYRLVVTDGTLDRDSLIPDFVSVGGKIDALSDRFDALDSHDETPIRWRVFRDRATSGKLLVYAADTSAREKDFIAVREVAARLNAAVVGCGCGAKGLLDAQKTTPEWDGRQTDLRIFYDPHTVDGYEFRIDAARKTPEVTRGMAHIFDFSLREPGAPSNPRHVELLPRPEGCAVRLEGETAFVEPKVLSTPIETIVEASETVLSLKERSDIKRVILSALKGGNATFVAVVNRELFKLTDGKRIFAEGFSEGDRSKCTSTAFSPHARTDATSPTRGGWWWLHRLAHKNREIASLNGSVDLVLVGDSITHFWEGCAYWTAGREEQRKLRQEFSVLNLGYGGDSTHEVCWRLENGELDGYRAKCVALMIGTNNRESAEEVASAIEQIVALIRRKQPDAKIVLQAILPRGLPDDRGRARNRATNELIRKLADDRTIFWLDISDQFLNADGTIAEGLMTDEPRSTGVQCLLHPYELGYEVWRKALVPYVRQAVSGQRRTCEPTRVSLAEEDACRPWSLWVRPEPTNLPELLRTDEGEKVTDRTLWENVRRPEILKTFAESMYGLRPVERPGTMFFKPIEPECEMMNGKAIRKRVRISYWGAGGEGSFNVLAFLPVEARQKPVPAFVLICNRSLEENADPDRHLRTGFFPAEEIVRRGYAAIIFKNSELASDDRKETLEGGVFDVFGVKPRQPHSWGVISAWAWGASRVLDWIETEPLLDARHVAVVGHSRCGKTALWAAASDARFAMACVNDSGCCGAKLNHVTLPMAENIELDNVVNPHWFCSAYRQWNGKDLETPFDMHQLAACIAPRLLAIASASEDIPAGPYGEYLTAKLCSPAWELYGLKGLTADAAEESGRGWKGFPAFDTPLSAGYVSYHIRRGEHDLDYFDWKVYMDFADRHGWRK